jgi:ABC-type nitrate/sulfonate/bicarbonate transport system substrate-binding protein
MKNGLLVLLVFLSLHVSVHAADKIRIGFPEFNSSTFTLPLAQIKGFFNEEGLQAELIRLRSAVVLPALTSGEIDYHTVVSPAVNAALRGIPVRVVACFTPGFTTAIIARPDIKTIQDLKGKTIGLNSIGGGLESTVRLMLRHYGLDLDKDVKFLAMGGVETRFAALKQGLSAATAEDLRRLTTWARNSVMWFLPEPMSFSAIRTPDWLPVWQESRKNPISSSA